MRNYRRANRRVAEYDPTNVFQNEGVWEIAEMVWDSRLLSYDVPDEVVEEKIRHYSETFLGEVADRRFVDSVMNILKENLKQSNRRANRRVASADHAEAVDFVFSSFDKDMEEFSWWYYNDYDGLYANVEKILSRGFTGGPFDIDKIIVDVVNGESRFSKRRANRRAAYYDDYIDPLINQGPTYPDYSHPDLNEWDYSTRDKVLSIIKDNPEVENDIKDVLRSGGNPRDVQNIFEDHFGWEGIAYDMQGEDWLSIAERYSLGWF